MSDGRAGHKIGLPHPIHQFEKILLIVAYSMSIICGASIIGTTLLSLGEYSIIYLLIKFRDRCVYKVIIFYAIKWSD